MAISKIVAGAKGSPLNSTGADVANAVNGLVDATKSYNGIKALESIEGVTLNVTGFYAGSTVGGGQFIYDAAKDKAEHNGGTVIAPEAIAAWDGTSGDIATLLNWVGAGAGCFVRCITGNDYVVEWFGAGNDSGDDSITIRACYDAAKKGTTVDSAIEVNTIRGYSDEYTINTPLILGDTDAVAIVDVEIMGSFRAPTSLPFTVKLRGFKNPQIKLGRIMPNGASVNAGVIVENTFGGDIFINQIGGYKSPLIYHGDDSYGFRGNAYVHFKCGQAGIKDSTVNVVEMTTVGIGYNNSIKTEITSARGDVFSKHTKGQGQIDPYNNNIYTNCGLEDIKLTGFDWEFSSFNHVDHPRLEGLSSNGGTKFTQGIVSEDSDCFGNTYDFFYAPISQIGLLNGESMVNGRLLDSSGAVRAKQMSQTSSGRIYISDKVEDLAIPNMSIFTEGSSVVTSTGNALSKYRGFFKDNSGTIHPYGLGTPYKTKLISSYTAGDTISCDYASTIDVTTNNGALNLRSHEDREMEGFELIVWLRAPNIPLTFASSDGSLPVAATVFVDAGVYMIKRIDFRWRAVKIGGAFVTS